MRFGALRIGALLGTAVVLAVPSQGAHADAWNTGVYAELNGGAVMVGNPNDVSDDVIGDAGLPDLGPEWTFGLGLGGAFAIGFDFGAIRLEGGVSYLSDSVAITRDKVEVDEATNEDALTMLAATGNAWYDISAGSGWTLYFGGGFGTANIGIHLVDIDVEEAPDYDFSTWSLAFQAGAGIGYHVADFMVIDLGYRLLGAIDPTLVKKGSVGGESFTWTLEPGTLLAHRVGIGMRVIFL